MAGILSTDFTEVELSRIGIKITGTQKADVVDCAGKLEEEMECKTMTKKCGTRTIKTRTKGTGNGTVKASFYCPQDLFATLHGMTREGLKDGVIAYGTKSQHAVASQCVP